MKQRLEQLSMKGYRLSLADPLLLLPDHYLPAQSDYQELSQHCERELEAQQLLREENESLREQLAEAQDSASQFSHNVSEHCHGYKYITASSLTAQVSDLQKMYDECSVLLKAAQVSVCSCGFSQWVCYGMETEVVATRASVIAQVSGWTLFSEELAWEHSMARVLCVHDLLSPLTG